MSNLLKPNQLALDWREGNLYFSSQLNSIVTVCGMRTKLCVTLPPIGHDAITKLAVDPRSAKLFVGGYTRKRGRYPSAAIYSLGMDGKEAPKVIAQGKIGRVSGLAVDPVKKLVFWSDLTSRELGVCSYLGTNRQVVTLSSQPRPTDLVLFGSKLFWTTHGFSWLHSHQIIFNSTVERTLSLPMKSHSMMFSHLSLEPVSRYPSLCTSLNCSQLCLLSSSTTASCSCSSGFLGTDNTSTICRNSTSDLSVSNQADGPSVIPLKNDRSLETAIIVILVIVIILVVALCFIFVQCRRTKRGPEIGIRFSSLAFGVGHSAANNNDWDQDQHVSVDKTGTGVGFSNPRFQSGATQNFQWKNSEVWPDSPEIDRDSPAILGGHSTPLVAMRDTDSAFQEPSLASSYDDDENQHLSVTSYKDKHRLLD